MLERIVTWLRGEFAGNPLWLWAVAILTAVLALLLLLIVRRITRTRLEARAPKTETRIDDLVLVLVRGTSFFFLAALSALLGSLMLDLGERNVILRRVIVVIALLQGGAWCVAVLTFVLTRWRERRPDDRSAATALVGAGFLGKLAVWSVVILLVLDNLGVQVTALLAGLGIGGIAVALAVQNILGDLFASLSIVLDKPFEIGDFIVVGDLMGTVEHVGLKTTRVRSLSGEQIVLGNADMLASRIRNFKRMSERRVTFTLGVAYETPTDKLAAIPRTVRTIIERQKDVRFDRAHFARYGDFALAFEVVYYVLSADFNRYMDVQQEINLEIHRRFAADGIEFAYPTQTLYLRAST